MKRIVSILLVAVMLVSLLPVSVFAENAEQDTRHPFTDVASDSWYEEYVQYVWENGLFTGTSPVEFSPEEILTRAMFVTVLGRMEAIDRAAYTEQVFSDVDPDSWYGPYVAWAAEENISLGVGEGKFAPDLEVTREQTAVFIHRYLNYKGKTVEAEELTYQDSEKISDYAIEAVSVCSSIGIFEGDEHGNFNPLNGTTRAEGAAVFTRLHKYINDTSSEVTEYYKVTFDYPDEMDASLKESMIMDESVVVEKGTLIYTLPLPAAHGYIFGGWFYDGALTQLVANEETVTENIILYPYLFASEAEDKVIYTPNFSTVLDVSAEEYYVTIKAKDEETLRSALFIHSVTEGDVKREPVITENGDGTYKVVPEGGFIEGGTYQFKALDRLDESIPMEDYIRFVENGELLGASVQFYNLTVAKEEYNELRLNDDIKFVSIDKVQNFSFENTSLVDLKLSEKTVSTEKNNATGGFTYHGSDLQEGDIIAIHDGVVDEKDPNVENCDHVSYLRITDIDGSSYSYGIADIEEVLFTPEVLPVPKDVQEGVSLTDNQDETYTLTVYNEYLDYTKYSGPAVNVKTDADVGDFVALYQGETLEESTYADYYEIVEIRAGSAVTEMIVVISSVEEIKRSAGMYEQNYLDLTLSEGEIADLEEQIATQALESGFADEAAGYVADMLANSGNSRMPEGFDPSSVQINVLDQSGEPITISRPMKKGVEAEAGVYTYNVKLGKVDVEANITNSLQEITSINSNIGIRAELSVHVPLEIQQVLIGGTTQNPGEWNTVLSSLDLDLTASFVQEFAIKTNFDYDEEWDVWFILPYISDIIVEIDVDVGTYTGVGVVVTMDTGAYDNAYDFENFISSFDSTYDPGKIKIGSLAKTLEAMMDDPYKFFGVEGDANSLLDDYREMMNDELEYVELLAIRLCKKDFYLPPALKIVHIQLIIEGVISAKASINIGASFEHLDVKRYSFRIEAFDGRATRNVTNLQNGYSNFNFYAMGNIALRAGGRFDFKIGVFSTKVANLGLMMETGPCLQLYGFFYFHYDQKSGQEPNLYHGGMYLVEIGWYLVIDFHGGVFNEMVGFNVHLLEEEWYFLKSGNGKFLVAPETPVIQQNVGGGETYDTFYQTPTGNLFDRATRLVEVDIRTGNTSIKMPALKDFDVVCTNPAFVTDLDENNRGTITVRPPEDPLIQTIEGQLRLTYKYATVPMSTTPITTVINLKWIKSYPDGIIFFEDENGNDLGSQKYEDWQRFTEGTHPTGLRYPDYKPPQGYDWNGQWHYEVYNRDRYSFDEIPFDAKTYVMKDEIITLKPTLIPQSNTPFTVKHYIESLEKPGTYELYMTETKYGVTGRSRGEDDIIEIEGFRYNRERSGGSTEYIEEYGSYYVVLPYYPVEGDGSTVVEYYYDRQSYYISLWAEPGSFYWYSELGANSTSSKLPYGSSIDGSVFENTVIPGYEFAGWIEIGAPEGTEPMTQLPVVTEQATYLAVWTPADNTPYTVTHLIELPGGGYETALTQTLTGRTDSPIDTESIAAAAVAEYPELFEAVTFRYASGNGLYDSSQRYTIMGSGASVIKLYYKREYHRVYWVGLEGNAVLSYFYEGQTITAPEQIPQPEVGYRFTHWSGLEEETVMGTEDQYFFPVFEGLEGIPYTVIHVRADLEHFHNVEDRFFTETETMYGKAGEAPTVNYRSYDGFTVIPYEPGDTVIYGDGSLIVPVKYQRNRYGLTLDANGGNLSYNRDFYYFGIDVTWPTVTREGYTFLGWYLEGDPNETLVEEINSYALTDLTYVAKWQADSIDYKVEHYLQEPDGSYGDPRVMTQTGFINEEVTAQITEFVGFTYDEGNALNVTTGYISDGKGNIADADGNAVVLRLYYSRNSYTATWYDYDGSKLADAQILYGAEITLPEEMAQPRRTGYTFGGWNDLGTMGTSGRSIHAATDGTWNANRYTVSYNANGGTGDMAEQSFVYDASQTLTANAFQYTNRNFMGWSTTSDGEVEYANNQAVSNLTAENGAVVTLYAVWELMEGVTVQYTVAHYIETLAGGYEKYTETTGYGLIEQQRTITATDAVGITGFTFDPNAENILTAVVKEDGSTVFEMYYSRNSYDLTLDFGGEQIKVAVRDDEGNARIVTKDEDPDRAVADQVIRVRYGEDLSAYLTELENEIGYTFAGWNNSNTTMPAEGILVTAQWTPVEVAVTFYPGTYWFFPDGTDTDAMAFTQTYRYGEEVTLPEGLLEQFYAMLEDEFHVEAGWFFGTYQGTLPTLSHFPLILVEEYYSGKYTFREYATDEEGNYIYDENGEYVYTDDYSVVVTPFWSNNYDVVAFDANGGEGSMSSMNVDYYGSRALPTCAFTREGYVFVGWNTAPDGSGTAFGVNDSIKGNNSSTTVMLYAQWEKAE